MNRFNAYRAQLKIDNVEKTVLGVPISSAREACQAKQAFELMSPIDSQPVITEHWVAGIIQEDMPKNMVQLYMQMAGLKVGANEIGPEQTPDQVDLEAFIGHAGVEALAEQVVHQRHAA